MIVGFTINMLKLLYILNLYDFLAIHTQRKKMFDLEQTEV